MIHANNIGFVQQKQEKIMLILPIFQIDPDSEALNNVSATVSFQVMCSDSTSLHS